MSLPLLFTVTPRLCKEKELEKAMPRIKWDHDMCHSHSQCQIAALDLFRGVDDRDVRYPEHITPERLKDAWAAANACRMQAVPIHEEC